MVLGFLYSNLFLPLARDYKYVGDGNISWSLVIVVILFFIGAEIANYFDKKHK